jgi:hypothetical protein
MSSDEDVPHATIIHKNKTYQLYNTDSSPVTLYHEDDPLWMLPAATDGMKTSVDESIQFEESDMVDSGRRYKYKMYTKKYGEITNLKPYDNKKAYIVPTSVAEAAIRTGLTLHRDDLYTIGSGQDLVKEYSHVVGTKFLVHLSDFHESEDEKKDTNDEDKEPSFINTEKCYVLLNHLSDIQLIDMQYELLKVFERQRADVKDSCTMPDIHIETKPLVSEMVIRFSVLNDSYVTLTHLVEKLDKCVESFEGATKHKHFTTAFNLPFHLTNDMCDKLQQIIIDRNAIIPGSCSRLDIHDVKGIDPYIITVEFWTKDDNNVTYMQLIEDINAYINSRKPSTNPNT